MIFCASNIIATVWTLSILHDNVSVYKTRFKKKMIDSVSVDYYN